jgi:transposase InsO family protein
MSEDPILARALFRYQIISPLLAMDVPRGQRTKMYQELARKEWINPAGEKVMVSAETVRYWLRRYKKEGFEGLKEEVRSLRGGKIPEEAVIKACQLKQEVPERSIGKIINIMEEMGLVTQGLLKKSTLHRYMQQKGLSRRSLKLPDTKDLARWQADYANDLWQSDMLRGPYLPDPDHPGQMKKTWLYTFIDDASRMIVYGRFFFKGDLPSLELVFKRAIQRCGVVRLCYYDNGQCYRARHMKKICAELGIHAPVFTEIRRPEGHGKVEAWNNNCTNNFLAELKASSAQTLDELNELFFVWVEYKYNRTLHSEIGCTPRERWLRDEARFRYVTEEKLRKAFLWEEERRVDKCAMIQLFTKRYRVSPTLTGRKIKICFNPEHLDLVEIWDGRKFVERVRPYVLQRKRPPKVKLPPSGIPPLEKKTDYLGFLKKKYKNGDDDIPSPDTRASVPSPGYDGSGAFVHMLKERISPEVFDEHAAREHWTRFGPIDIFTAAEALDDLLMYHPPNLHISFYLDHLKGEKFHDH